MLPLRIPHRLILKTSWLFAARQACYCTLSATSANLAPSSRFGIGSGPTNKFLDSNTNARTAQIARHLNTSPPTVTASQPPDTMAQLPVSDGGYNAKAASEYSVRRIGQPNTLEHRIYLEKNGVPMSPFHDLPLYANQQQTILNMIVEVPRWTNAKMEVRAPPAHA